MAMPLLTASSNIIPAIQPIISGLRRSVLIGACCFVWIFSGRSSCKCHLKTLPDQPAASGKPFFRSTGEHWFQIQIILKLEELFNMLLTNKVLGSCCVINPCPGLHVGFCMLPQHFKTNFMQLCLKLNGFLKQIY